MTSPRLLRPRSYSLQFRILYCFLYSLLTRLDFAATMTLPSDLYDGLDPTPAASVLAYTNSCTNATKGSNPFANISYGDSGKKLSSIVKCYTPSGNDSKGRYAWIKKHLANAVEEAIKIRNDN